jgi:hypothetical protein
MWRRKLSVLVQLCCLAVIGLVVGCGSNSGPSANDVGANAAALLQAGKLAQKAGVVTNMATKQVERERRE